MRNNRLMIAAAGSGKTTYLVDQAKEIKDKNVLITTYTEANTEEIKKKFNGHIPKNITIQTWFSFLLQHGVRPYQGVLNDDLHNKRIGFFLTEKPSGLRFEKLNNQPVYWGEKDFFNYYFTKNFKIFSDKIAKFIFSCNKETEGEVMKRIAKIYPYIFIDEIQDLAGWELEIVKLLFGTNSEILLVGDPRQVTYLTHHPTKYKKYKDGKIENFIAQECASNVCKIDTMTLKRTHRNNQSICDFSAQLFPNLDKCEPCNCEKCHQNVQHEGVFLIKPDDVSKYLVQFPETTVLREKNARFPEWNFGKSKGLTFDRVLIYPTQKIVKWIKNSNTDMAPSTRCKFYVAITRARHSVGIVYDYSDSEDISGTEKWK